MTSIQSLAHSMQAQWRRHEVLANNLANVSTPSFKKDDLVITPPDPSRTVAGALVMPAAVNVLQWTDFTQGGVQLTGRPLDVAITGSGFLVVQTPAGERYTRSGSLSVGADGILVGPSGDPLASQRGGPVRVEAGSQVTVSATGDVVAGGRVVDTLKVVDLPRPYALLKEGNGLYAPVTPETQPVTATGFEITAGALESSNVNAMESMVTMIEVLRTYEAAQRAIQAADEINQRAIETGRVT
jgi:flagellar basal-body rod protein FlgG